MLKTIGTPAACKLNPVGKASSVSGE